MLYAKVFGQAEHVVLQDARKYVREESAAKAGLLVRLAVVDARKLYVPAGYPSMYEYCVGELGLSEDAALRRLNAARIAREFPPLFDALADGRIQLSTILVLSTYLNAANATELIEAASQRKTSALRDWLACRFPRPALPTRVVAVGPSGARTVLPPTTSAGLFEGGPSAGVAESHAPARPVPTQIDGSANTKVPLPARGRVEVRSAGCIAYQFSTPRRTQDRLQLAFDLPGQRVAPGDIGTVFALALDALIEKLEKRRCAATAAPRAPRAARSQHARHVPAHVRRKVWERDGGRCTFVSASSRRCECRRALELDHVTPVARGGGSTVANLRLRCRAHNQYEAERTFGEGFMRGKRDAAKRCAAQKKAAAPAAKHVTVPPELDVRPALRELRFRRDEIEIGAAAADALSGDATLEARLRAALKALQPRGARKEIPVRTQAA